MDQSVMNNTKMLLNKFKQGRPEYEFPLSSIL